MEQTDSTMVLVTLLEGFGKLLLFDKLEKPYCFLVLSRLITELGRYRIGTMGLNFEHRKGQLYR
jgi:hypothetical protein